MNLWEMFCFNIMFKGFAYKTMYKCAKLLVETFVEQVLVEFFEGIAHI